MRPSRTAVQRLALFALGFCLVFFVGSRLMRAAGSVAGGVSHRADHHEEGHDYAYEYEYDAGVEAARYDGQDEVLFERSFPVRPGDRLMMTLSSEDLVIETGTGEAGVTVTGRGRDAREAFARRRFTADYAGGTLTVETDPERDGLRRGGEEASYTVVVRVPEEMTAEVHLASGDVEAGDLTGDLHLDTASGDVGLGRV
jgi:hypothetical protein